MRGMMFVCFCTSTTALLRPLSTPASSGVRCAANGSPTMIPFPAWPCRSQCRLPNVLLVAPQPPPDEQQARLTKLLVSVLIDLIGMATYVVPLAGEAGDLAWAPISALLIQQLYGNGLLTGLAFAEELLPGLDIIPTATIAWLLENTDFGQQFNAKAPPSAGEASSSASASASRADGMRQADGKVVDDTYS